MGLITSLFDLIFGNGRNVLRETAEVFRENTESGATRDHQGREQALSQFAAEFLPGQRGRFDRFMDAVNRLPRPMMALGCLGLFTAAMINPQGFALRMQGIALVPDPLWWLLGVVVSFYFGARHQMKGQEFQRNMLRNLSQNQRLLQVLREAEPHPSPQQISSKIAQTDAPLPKSGDNPALEDWRAKQRQE
ncbi:holin family protein [Cognatishimia sp. WU-CL00825]|uniref:holin family protein n=1 Tax=Cognatishimia sp. WU-CL00825 TaxID=3127658 RepID=UPI003105298F